MRALLLETLQGLAHLAIVRAPRRFMVRDLHRELRPSADLNGLVEGFKQPFPLITHVSGVEAAVARSNLGDRDDLIGVRIRPRHVYEAGGKAEGALRHRLL